VEVEEEVATQQVQVAVQDGHLVVVEGQTLTFVLIQRHGGWLM
jgi:hypothetical protein